MVNIIEMTSERLLIRQWKQTDREHFAQMNADPRVMEFFPSTYDRAHSDRMADIIERLIAERGWGFWALEERSTARFVGFTGLHQPTYDLPFNPCVEIGWRLQHEFWGKGLAFEAASAALDCAFDRLRQNEVVSFTTVNNHRSRRLMERLGLRDTHNNFEHPAIEDGHPLKTHVLYKITGEQWLLNRSN